MSLIKKDKKFSQKCLIIRDGGSIFFWVNSVLPLVIYVISGFRP